MSENYCVMNMKKNKRADVKGLQDEANRTAENYKNEIKENLTCLNYYFKKCDDWNSKITEILEENKIDEKDRSVVLITSVYSASPEFFKTKSYDEIVKFFEKCLEFEQRKGEVISAVIHLDETTPHMQTATVPLVDVPVEVCNPVPQKDEKGNILTDSDGNIVPERYKSGSQKGRIKYKRTVLHDENGNVVTHRGLSAKTVFGNKVKMSKTQTEFYEMCGKPYGLSRGEIRVETQEEAKKHLTEAQHKAEQIVKEAEHKADQIVKGAETSVNALREQLRLQEEELQVKEEKTLKTRNIVLQAMSDCELKMKEQEQAQKELQKREDALQAREMALKQQEKDLNSRAIKWRSDMQKSFKDKLSRIKADYEEKCRNYKEECDEVIQEISEYASSLPDMSANVEKVLDYASVQEQGKAYRTPARKYLQSIQTIRQNTIRTYREIPDIGSEYSSKDHDWGYGE